MAGRDPPVRAALDRDERQEPVGPGACAADPGDRAAHRGRHPDHPGPGAGPIGPSERQAHDDLPAGPVGEHPDLAQLGRRDARLRQRGSQDPQAPRRPGGRDRIRQGAEGRVAPLAQPAPAVGDREPARPRVLRPLGRDQARPGVVPRGHRPSPRHHLRRERQPRQRPGAGPRGAGPEGPDRRPADRVPLRQGSARREDRDPARGEEGRYDQHQCRHSRERADQGDTPDLPEGRQLLAPDGAPRPRARRARTGA